MSELPLARTSMVHALLHDETLIIYAEGFTTGFGGKLVIERSPDRILPQPFKVRYAPGNDGINPDASPRDVPTQAAYSFDRGGVRDSILIQDADGQREVGVVRVQPEKTDDGERDENQVGDGGADENDADWTAVHDFMPPGPARLKVSGTLTLPTPGYQVSLRPAVPQGFNPLILILDLDIVPPSGIVSQVVTRVPVGYEQTTNYPYTQVTLRSSDGTLVTVDVQQVH